MFKKGCIPWNKGKPRTWASSGSFKKGHVMSKESIEKRRKTMTGRKRPEHAKKMRELYKVGRLKIYRTSEDFTEEARKKISEAGKGRKTWNKGLTGIKTGPPKGFVPWHAGKPWSKEIREKISKSRKKTWDKVERKSNKKGRWKLWKWRNAVVARDKKCQVCGSKKSLEAHHVLPLALFPKLATDIKNGITLCHKCHRKTETYGKRLDLEDEVIVRTTR